MLHVKIVRNTQGVKLILVSGLIMNVALTAQRINSLLKMVHASTNVSHTMLLTNIINAIITQDYKKTRLKKHLYISLKRPFQSLRDMINLKKFLNIGTTTEKEVVLS